MILTFCTMGTNGQSLYNSEKDPMKILLTNNI